MKKKKWLKPRHRIITSLACAVLKPVCKLKYNIDIVPFKEQGKRPYLILLNHQTPFDQFFVGCSFKGPVYYLATEDIFSLGFLSTLLKWAVAPIPIRKQTSDASAVLNCLRVAKEGGTLCIAPEGNRTYSGKTEYMNPAISALAKKLNYPIALYRIEGGYGSEPRWSDKVRKGKMRSYVSKIIEPEEYKDLSNEELHKLIEEGLYVNEASVDFEYKNNERAQYLERAIYVCPYCGLSVFESSGNEIECKKCHRKISYGADKKLTGLGFDFPFPFVNDWYEYQKNFINSLDVTAYSKESIYEDEADISKVLLFKKKLPFIEKAKISLYGDKVIVNEKSETPIELLFSEVTAAAVLGRNKLNIYHGGNVYQIKGSKRFNALKYVNLYFRFKNIQRGEENGEFLGL